MNVGGQELEGDARGRGGDPRLYEAALRPDHRRRPGRHRARRAAAPARRADHHHREERARGRQLAQALQVALPARPGLVRPPALHRLPEELAGVLAQGQDRRLARDVHEGDGAELLDEDRGKVRQIRREDQGVDRRRRPRWPGGRAPSAVRVCDRHVRQGERAEVQGRRDLSRATSTIPRSIPAPTPSSARRWS